jgi:hypothetical protein
MIDIAARTSTASGRSSTRFAEARASRDRLLGCGRRLDPRHGVAVDLLLFLKPAIQHLEVLVPVGDGRGGSPLEQVGEAVLEIVAGGVGEAEPASSEELLDLIDGPPVALNRLIRQVAVRRLRLGDGARTSGGG